MLPTAGLTLTLKMEAVKFVKQCGKVRKTARKFVVQPRQIRECVKIIRKSRKRMKKILEN